MTKKNKNFAIKDIKDFIFESIKLCKIKSAILLLFALITFLTGIIVAIKTHKSWGTSDGMGIINTKTGALTSSFFTRLLSMMFVYLILLGCSFHHMLFPIAVIFLSYRGYLLGLNITLMIIFYGFSGAIISILVALPCQLFAILSLMIFYILMHRTSKDYACYGGSRYLGQRTKISLSFVCVLMLICLIESFLLFMFSAKIILVI